MNAPDPDPGISSQAERRARVRRKAKKAGKKAVRLTGTEYLPMALMLTFWAIVALQVRTADVARLLAATVLMQAPLMLTRLSSIGPVRRRWHQSAAVRQQAIRKATLVQLGVLAALVAETALIALLLVATGQQLVAELFALCALCYPAKLYRAVDPRTSSSLFRLFLGLGGVTAAGLAYLLGSGPWGFALAFAARDWLATIAMLLRGVEVEPASKPTDQPLHFAEIARTSVVSARRMLTYRLTKNILAVFGPFGNFAARTGRGLSLHSRLEPYMPHKRTGFAAFVLLTLIIAVVLVERSGKPVALVAGAGAMQLSALAASVLIWWRYLPNRDDPTLILEEDEDE